jgi:hypothetical protein
MGNDTHISDQDLIRAVDGELSNREATRIHAHLAACWGCRARRAELDRTIEDFVGAYRDLHKEPPSNEGPRALLRARLSQLEDIEPQSFWQRLRQLAFHTRAPFYASLCLVVLSVIVGVMYVGVRQVRAASVPDTTLTPGATRTASISDVCSSRSTRGFYPIPATLAYRVFEKYRIRNPRPRTYEVDYLITPALGGADDVRNLWPQPYAAGEWNAHVKDALEDYLHKKVCAGELNLEVVQRDIASNWIAAYQKYFHTERPLPDHENFSVDAPWED